MSSVGEALKQALEVIAAQKAWIYAVPLDAPLPTMPGFDREWADGVELALKDVIGDDEAQGVESSPTAGMNMVQRILHVGGRNNAAGYVEFGSIQAVEALVRHVLRDKSPIPAREQAALIARLREAVAVAVTMLYDSHTVDTLAEFSIDELNDISKLSESLGDKQVEHVYRQALQAADMLEADAPTDCTRSHPHENMSKMCELRTDIARLQNERKRKVNDALTDRKTDSIIERGYQHTGYVLRHPDTGERAIIESQAVRWVKADDMAVIMHREGRIQRQPMTSEQIKAAIFGVLSCLEVTAPNCQHWDEYAAGEIARVFENPGAA